MGVAVEQVDSGGQARETMSRPDPVRQERGPLARVLEERINGSAQAVDARATSVGQRTDGLANARADGESTNSRTRSAAHAESTALRDANRLRSTPPARRGSRAGRDWQQTADK